MGVHPFLTMKKPHGSMCYHDDMMQLENARRAASLWCIEPQKQTLVAGAC